MPTITSHFNYAGTNGGQWVKDTLGPRLLTIPELAMLHSYDEKAIAFLANQTKPAAMGYIARGIPVKTLTALYDSFAKHLQHDDDLLNKPVTPLVVPTEAAISVSQVMSGQTGVFPDLETIAAKQRKDSDINPLFDYIKNGKRDEDRPRGPYYKYAPFMCIHKDVLFYREVLSNGEVITDAVVVPTDLRQDVMQAVHTDPFMAHPGLEATKLAIKERAFWPKMNRNIISYHADCGPCKKARHQTRTHAGMLRSQLFRDKLDVLGVDLVGPFKECDGKKWLLHGLDWSTGFNFVVPLPNKKMETVAAAIVENVFLKYGFPTKMFSDRGGEFVNNLLAEVTKLVGVEHCKTCAWSPQGNSRTENRHKQYNYILKILCNEYAMTWTTAIHYANWALNTRPWFNTNHSPYELLFGRKPRQPFDFSVSVDQPADLNDEQMLRHYDIFAANCQASVEDAIIASQRANRIRTEKQLYSVKHMPGDLVLTHIPRVKKGITTRLRYQTIGPFEVLEHNSPPSPDGSFNVYRLKHLGSGQETTVNVRQILPYISRKAHEATAKKLPTPTPSNKTTLFDPKIGEFVLLPNEGGVAYQLLRVVDREGNHEVTAQYLNTTNKDRLTRFRSCWQHDSKCELQSNAPPKNKGYTAWTDTFDMGELCQRVIKPVKIGAAPNGAWFNLSKNEVQRTLGSSPLFAS